MALPPASERGISQKPEIKHFSEVRPEEIAEATSGKILYFANQSIQSMFITYENLDLEIVLRPHPNPGFEGKFLGRLVYGEGESFLGKILPSINDSMVIFDDSGIKFVPARRTDGYKEIIEWFSISKDGGSVSFNGVGINKKEKIDQDIAKASDMATDARKKRFNL
ncbi:MAG: hypothetical protein M1268_04570 [Patescibacteria group bacterium]|nr:hypothetical protein [Patescibacteria group bacterium]